MPEESIMQATLSRQALAREEQRFTGVHHRAAIPHARSSAVTQPTLALARLRERGVVWAEGEEPLRLIFPITVTEDAGKAHLKLLSKLTERDEDRITGGSFCSYYSLIIGPCDLLPAGLLVLYTSSLEDATV